MEQRVSEVVAPAGIADRRAWLRENFPWDAGLARRHWRDVDPALLAWRDSVVGWALDLKEDTRGVLALHRDQCVGKRRDAE